MGLGDDVLVNFGTRGQADVLHVFGPVEQGVENGLIGGNGVDDGFDLGRGPVILAIGHAHRGIDRDGADPGGKATAAGDIGRLGQIQFHVEGGFGELVARRRQLGKHFLDEPGILVFGG